MAASVSPIPPTPRSAFQRSHLLADDESCRATAAPRRACFGSSPCYRRAAAASRTRTFRRNARELDECVHRVPGSRFGDTMLRRMLSRDRSQQRDQEMDPIKNDTLLSCGRGVELSDDEGVCDDEEAIGTTDSPPPDDCGFFDSLDVGLADDLCIRLCRDDIRANLMELARTTRHGAALLQDIESGTLGGSEAVTAVGNNLLLLWGSFLGRNDLVQASLDAGADLKFCEPAGGLGALHLSASSGAVECTRLLLRAGARPNDAERGISPLHCAVAGNAVETARILIEAGAPPRESGLLHAAVRLRAVECLQLLLGEKADPEDKEDPSGWTPLHVAADAGTARCLKLLLDSNADVCARTPDRNALPLHLAAEGGHVECVDLILNAGPAGEATAREIDRRGRTPLHLAARSQSVECAELLLRKGSFPNARDADMRTPLHAAVGRGLVALEMVELLIKNEAHVNAADIYGYTALHVAALNELTPCVNALLNNGADVSAKTRGGTSALGVLARKTPASLDTLAKKFDAAISMHDPEASLREVELKLDFRTILQHSKIGETSFLKTFVDEADQNVFLEHPLCQAFLHLKWLKIRKFYVGRMVLWAVLTVFLSIFVLTNYVPCSRGGTTNQPTNDTGKCRQSFLGFGAISQEAKWWILLVFTIIEALRKLHGLAGYSSIKLYLLQMDNITEWLVLISVPVMSVYATGTMAWQTNVGAFSVLVAWTNLMVLIGQLPVFGTYVAMYTRVQGEVAKLLVAYACLLIGFTISFCVMFPSQDVFENPFVGLIKVLVMMTGELDFQDLFKDFTGKSAVMEVSAYLIFMLFLLLVTIALMNLMVGIAVHDIQGLHKTATLSKLVSQATLISHIELALFNGYLPAAAKRLLRKSAFVSPSGYRVVINVKPLNPREQRLPRPILQAAYAVVQRRRRGAFRAPSGINASVLGRPSMLRRACYNIAASDAEGTLSDLVREVNELKEALRVNTTLLSDLAKRSSPPRRSPTRRSPTTRPPPPPRIVVPDSRTGQPPPGANV